MITPDGQSLGEFTFDCRAGQPAFQQVTIREGRNTYVLVTVPDREIVGHVVVSGSGDAGGETSPQTNADRESDTVGSSVIHADSSE